MVMTRSNASIARPSRGNCSKAGSEPGRSRIYEVNRRKPILGDDLRKRASPNINSASPGAPGSTDSRRDRWRRRPLNRRPRPLALRRDQAAIVRAVNAMLSLKLCRVR